ncbi:MULTISPECIES: MlaD family protein [unclassified Coleofasciculus]|uniref:MlaD family protein n=1 Tax=unclassified Coleofasciculus TaxID=2692782 RepID=UPI0018807194|nr:MULTISPECIES: MlaD family protein [unclassified Coleofasciculus]MBE9125071.1 MCE family protein [Coleofasciculus sp. LEGE 07081]MBE9151297.1 MCE family protein [Coleofasciculus sp. LEGE 07092]
MRSRTIREGSVGLLILTGLVAFVGLVLWIRGLRLGNQSYKFIVNFADVAGMKEGAPVRYRGVDVGSISDIQATTNGVDVTVEIDSAELVIPQTATIEANQSGLIGETSVDITPQTTLASGVQSINPLSPKCNSDVLICAQDHVQGEIGVSFIELLRNTDRLTQIVADPVLFDNITSLTKNASLAAGGVAQLTNELSQLTRAVRGQVATFSSATNSVTTVATQTANRIGNTADQFSQLAASSNELLDTNQKTLNETLQEFNQLANSLNQLVAANRGTLQNTLQSISQTSQQLDVLLTRLTTTAEQVEVEGVLDNLETLTANAAAASENLRDISTNLNDPTNALVLQQLLDSARATFENTQKITADLDDLTGDPEFRRNVRQLVNGLSQLVSSTDQLEEQIQVAQQLELVSDTINHAASTSGTEPSVNQLSQSNIHLSEANRRLSQQKRLFKLSPPAPRKDSADSEAEND